MRYLTQGGQTDERLHLLLSLTKISSENVREALRDYLVRGFNDATAALINDVKPSNFNRALASLEQVAATVEQIKQLDLSALKSVK
jgi:hypothetical protein